MRCHARLQGVKSFYTTLSVCILRTSLVCNERAGPTSRSHCPWASRRLTLPTCSLPPTSSPPYHRLGSQPSVDTVWVDTLCIPFARQVQELLRGSRLQQRAEGIREAAAATCTELMPLVTHAAAAAAFGPVPVTEDDLRCGGAAERQDARLATFNLVAALRRGHFQPLVSGHALLPTWWCTTPCGLSHAAADDAPAARVVCAVLIRRWPLCMLLSRSFNLLSAADDPAAGTVATALVPFGDLLNHDPAAECFLLWDDSLHAVVLRPDRPYQPGEQARNCVSSPLLSTPHQESVHRQPPEASQWQPFTIAAYRQRVFQEQCADSPSPFSLLQPCNQINGSMTSSEWQVFASYGEKTSGQLLLSYGFAPVHDNPHDGCDLLLSLDPDDPQRDAKAALLAERGMEAAVEFPLKLGGWPAAMLPYAAFLCASTGGVEELRYVAAQLFDRGNFPRSTGASLEAMAATHVLDRCKDALAGYGTSLQGDLAVIQALSAVPKDKLSAADERKLLTAAIRIIERRALERTVSSLTELRRRTLR